MSTWTLGRAFVAMTSLTLGAAPLAPGASAQERGPQGQRYNRMVGILENGQPVFGSSVDRTPDAAQEVLGDPLVDFIWYDLEHSAFDVTQLKTFLQFTLDPVQILARGRPGTDRPVLVRIPVNGREVAMNQWLVKNVLDQGVHGIIAPFIENADQARALVSAMRFPQPPGAAVPEPVGYRGASGGSPAIRFWGLERSEYVARADLWGLTPRGEMIAMVLIENLAGVENIREIVQVPGVSIVMAATGDLGFSLGGDQQLLEQSVQKILAACKEFGVLCAIPAGGEDVERRIREGFRVFLARGDAATVGRRASGRGSR